MHHISPEFDPIVVDFPLRGEWVALNTPAERVPSHGTDQLGQRFAYDFIRIERNRKDLKFYRVSVPHYLLLGARLRDCYGWSEPIYAPFDGTVVSSKDGWPERQRLHISRDLAIVLKNALVFDPKKTKDLRPILGNNVIVKMKEKGIFALFAHARHGSVRVGEGEEVRLGQHLADVGHSGNSTAPHLHFHLMDSENILKAQGLPCRFREYEALNNGVWSRVTEGIPAKRQFVRYAAQQAA